MNAMLHKFPGAVRYKDPAYEQVVTTLGRERAPAKPTILFFTGMSGRQMQSEARAVAARLGKPLHVVNSKEIVGKYIGETEKNLAMVLRKAASAGLILLFDEADALFGGRTRVHDAHDKYANLETSHLLEAIEQHRGITILTTNNKATVDSAKKAGKSRKLVVKFPP